MSQNHNQGELFIQNSHSGQLHPDSELVVPLLDADPNPGLSIPLDQRNATLIKILDNIAEARKDEGFVEASRLPAHRARISRTSGNIDREAENARKKSVRLKSEARTLFDEHTGIPAMQEQGVEEIAGIEPEVLIISAWRDFSDQIAKTKDLQKLRSKLSKNLDNMA